MLAVKFAILHFYYVLCTLGCSEDADFDAHLGFCTLKHADFRNDREKNLRQREVLPFWAQTLAHN